MLLFLTSEWSKPKSDSDLPLATVTKFQSEFIPDTNGNTYIESMRKQKDCPQMQ